MAVMLDVKNINVYYGAIHAVKDISFQVNEGEIVTLIGANGAGKTTTLQTVSGLLHTRTGSIEFLGQPIQNVPASKLVGRGLAQVPEGRRGRLSPSSAPTARARLPHCKPCPVCSTPAPAPLSSWGSPSRTSPPPSWWAADWPRCRRAAGSFSR